MTPRSGPGLNPALAYWPTKLHAQAHMLMARNQSLGQ